MIYAVYSNKLNTKNENQIEDLRENKCGNEAL